MDAGWTSGATRGGATSPSTMSILRARATAGPAAVLLLLAAVLLVAGPARAERGGPAREGWVLGLVLGKGSGDFTVVEGDRAATTGWSGGGRILRGRVGRYLTGELLLTAEYGVWRRAAAGDSTVAEGGAGWTEPVDRYLGSGFLAVSLYPRMDGFSLRAGLGYGLGLAQATVDGVVVRQQRSGPMLLMGVGWEFGISEDMSMVLGADFGRLETGDELSGNFAHFTATFRLHLLHGLPRDWF